jgi:Tfp pilus assembly protein PilF
VREAFDKAIALAPRDAEAYLQYGWALAAAGDQARSISMLQRSAALDPERSVTRFTLAMVFLIARRPAEGQAQLDTALAADPTAPNLHGMRAWTRLMTGDVDGARADAMTETVDLRLAGSALAAIQARSGDSAAARLTAQRMVSTLPPAPARLTWGAAWQAGGLAVTGQTDRVMEMLERIEPQGLTVWLMCRWPAFDAIRSDPRFARFTAELAPQGVH